jgi:hypothetical protein
VTTTRIMGKREQVVTIKVDSGEWTRATDPSLTHVNLVVNGVQLRLAMSETLDLIIAEPQP